MLNLAYGKVGSRLIGNTNSDSGIGLRTAHHFNPNDPIAIGGSNVRSGRGLLGYGSNNGIFNANLVNNSHSGFAGFQLPASKGGGFGWIRFDVINRNADGYPPDEVKVIDWAYNDAGGGINAGQTVDAVPEPGGKALALLALGSAGVLAWRRGKRMKVEG